MSVLITSIIVAGGVLLGRFIGRGSKTEPPALPAAPTEQNEQSDKNDQNERSEAPPKTRSKKEPPAASAGNPLEDFPCQLGDVLMRSGRDEAWLAGALVFAEGTPSVVIAVLFVAPEAGKDIAIFARPKPSTEISWLLPVDAADFRAMAEPPTSLEHEGTRFERQRRIPLRASRAGTGAPDVGENVILAEYTSSGAERMVVVAGSGTSHAYRGTALEEGMYEVIASGKSTLED